MKVILWGHFWISKPESEPKSILAFGSSGLNLQHVYLERAVHFPPFIFPISWAEEGNNCLCLSTLYLQIWELQSKRTEVTQQGHVRSHTAGKWQTERLCEWLGDELRLKVHIKKLLQGDPIPLTTPTTHCPSLVFAFKVTISKLVMCVGFVDLHVSSTHLSSEGTRWVCCMTI